MTCNPRRFFAPAFLALGLLFFSCSDKASSPDASSGIFDGTAAFADKFAHDDSFQLQVSGLPPIKADQVYQGWLTGSGSLLSIGTLTTTSDGHGTLVWVSPTGENLLDKYSGFEATLGSGSGGEPRGKVIFSGKITPLAEQLFVSKGSAPSAPAPGLKSQIDLAVEHAGMAEAAGELGAWQEMKAHLEHVLNILEGQKGVLFGDYLGTGVAQDPGDGWGAKTYGEEVYAQLKTAVALQASADQTKKEFLADVQAVEKTLLMGLKHFRPAQASSLLDELKTRLTKLKTGPAAELYELATQNLFFPLGLHS